MQAYLVGGAVRDQLLQLPVTERDWVVVGSTVETMLKNGFIPVGKDFPVFLHPQSKEEYALARKERKSGQGYTGFECISDPNISLEEDLLRRDLTINAIAKDENGQLYDPFGGLIDLQNKVLRHVSPAFVEDPLRVLRVARFAARFYHLGFTIAEETLALMQDIALSGELAHLTTERVWRETEKALNSQSPDVYFRALRACGALAILFPELEALFGIPQTEKYHPEIDTGEHVLMVIQQAAKLSDDIAVRFAALCHDFGKAFTPESNWPHHYNHESLGLTPVKAFCQRLKVPKACQELALLVCQYHLLPHQAFKLKAKTIYQLFSSLDVWRKPERLEQFLLACEADSRGRLGFENIDYPQADYFRSLFQAASAIGRHDIAPHLTGKAIGEAIAAKRIACIAQHQYG